MCDNCYHAKGRFKKAWKCVHKNKAHFAKGVCQNCYQIIYFRQKDNYIKIFKIEKCKN